MKKINLETLSVKNFKCFKNLKIQFGNLTVLSGYNGAGKSSAIQPLLLLSQMLNDFPKDLEDRGKYWPLNGNQVRLGRTIDVIYENFSKLEIEFEFGFSNRNTFNCKLKVDKSKDYLVSHKIDKKQLNSMEFVSNLNFISAKRGDEENLYPRPDNNYYSNVKVGADGRFSSFVYDNLVDDIDVFRSNVDNWLELITPGVKTHVTPFSDSRFFELRFQYSTTSKRMLPANVGYGLTYAFPIIVATVASSEGDIVIIDSPEAHLHPLAQSKMGWKLAEMAAKGIQVIVETHSDHVLNGVRLAVKEGILKPDCLSLLFFAGATDQSDGLSRPKINEKGKIADWPKGFFDQIETDLASLIGVK